MTLSQIVLSALAGGFTGFVYGLSFMRQDLTSAPSHADAQRVRREKFITFFLMATLRILFIVLLWHYVLRTASLNIILVLISFLTGFWATILKKKVLDHERL